MTARSTAQGHATTIRDEVTANANTATRVGVNLKELCDNAAFTEDVGGTIAAQATLDGLSSKSAVHCSTTGPLAGTWTYDNTAGTLTRTTNGALENQDDQVMSAGLFLLVRHEAAVGRRGKYAVTVLGTGSVACVLTKTPDFATAAQMRGASIYVIKGTRFGGHTFKVDLSATDITVGTTDPGFTEGPQTLYACGAHPADRIAFKSDFRTAPSATVPDEGGFIAVAAGTGAAVTNVTNANSASLMGLWQSALGTGATSQTVIWAASGTGATGGGTSVLLGATDAFYYSSRNSTSTLSTSGQKCAMYMGFCDVPGTAGPTSGVYFAADSDNNPAYTMHVMLSSTETTAVATGSTIVADQKDHLEIWSMGGADPVHFAVNGVECVNSPLAKTNLPVSKFCAPQIVTQRLAGTTTGLLFLHDWCTGWVQPATARAARIPMVCL